MKPMSDFVKDKDVPDKNVGDTISRQAAIDEAEKHSLREGAYGYMDTKSIIDMLEDLPSAEPERKTGQWLPSRDRDYNECSCCHRITEPQVVAYKFCPYCGAEMTN